MLLISFLAFCLLVQQPRLDVCYHQSLQVVVYLLLHIHLQQVLEYLIYLIFQHAADKIGRLLHIPQLMGRTEMLRSKAAGIAVLQKGFHDTADGDHAAAHRHKKCHGLYVRQI